MNDPTNKISSLLPKGSAAIYIDPGGRISACFGPGVILPDKAPQASTVAVAVMMFVSDPNNADVWEVLWRRLQQEIGDYEHRKTLEN